MKRPSSVKSRTFLLLFVFLSALLAVFLFNIHYIRRTASQRILETVAASTASRLETITNSMSESALSTQQMVQYQTFGTLSEDPSVWFFYYRDLQATLNILESGRFQYSGICYFAYNHRQDYFLRSSTHSMPIYEEKEIAAWLGSLSSFPSYVWNTQTFHGTDYYIYGISQGDFYCGVFLSASSVLRLLSSSSLKDTYFAVIGTNGSFTAADEHLPLGELLKGSDSLKLDGAYYALQRYHTRYDFDVISATRLPRGIRALFAETPYLYLVILFLFLFVPAFYFFLKQELIKPLNYLRFGFSRVASGDLSFRGRQNLFSREFNEVILAFNSMLRQIRELRMHYYEEKIRQQQAENRYLRTISYPHFLLNNLNLINNFAYEKNEEGIHTAVMNLSAYLRYFITADSSSHTLRNDVESARCYLNLNQLAYPGRIEYTFEAQEDLLDLPFPPLIISTIVENCIKHGLLPGQSLRISLVLKKVVYSAPAAQDGSGAEDSQEYLLFEARNNGPAFPESVLAMVNSAEIPDKNTTHIGLISVKQTLHARFQDHCLFQIRNARGGVIVTIQAAMNAFQKEVQQEYQ